MVKITGYKNVSVGTKIEANRGVVIGAELIIVGAPRHAKVPIKVVFWHETLPRNANGKILKRDLKGLFGAE